MYNILAQIILYLVDLHMGFKKNSYAFALNFSILFYGAPVEESSVGESPMTESPVERITTSTIDGTLYYIFLAQNLHVI